jgi:mRNA-degrading endonuclease YafQ of YafQ-DinJ toxin-antitoxin module
MNKPIVYSDKFHKHYLQRIVNNKNLLSRVEQRIELFCIDPKNPILHDHSLKGQKNLLSSFSVTGDYRIIYQEFPDHYNFLDIGKHNQVY